MDQNTIDGVARRLRAGEIGVIPTDTIYGIVASALDPQVVDRVYDVKQRSKNKRFIVLISHNNQLRELGISINDDQKHALRKVWPGPVSVDLRSSTRGQHLHRGWGSIAVRLPDLRWLLQIIDQTGPLIATSANKANAAHSSEISEIRRQLPDLDFYIQGPVQNEPSKLIRIEESGTITELQRN